MELTGKNVELESMNSSLVKNRFPGSLIAMSLCKRCGVYWKIYSPKPVPIGDRERSILQRGLGCCGKSIKEHAIVPNPALNLTFFGD